MSKKAWYRSKTLWVNAIAAGALVLQTQTGFIIDAELQGALLAMINLVLRQITKDAIGLRNEKALPPEFPGIDAGPANLNKYPDLQGGGPGVK